MNLFTLYVRERACHMSLDQWIKKEDRKKRIADHIVAGAPFDKWKGDPFLALLQYVQLQEEFGWGAFQRVFAQYRDAPPEALPKNDDEKRDQWMVRFSREVNCNLGPFFEMWGVPVSKEARDSIAGLPVWMPEGFPPKKEPEAK